MSVLPELEQRLSDIEKRIAALLQHLEDHAILEQSLRDAGSGLNDASQEVKRLAESTKIAYQNLAGALASFTDAAKFLRRSDPVKLTEAVASIREQLNNAEQEIKEAIGESRRVVSSERDKAEQQLKTEAQLIREAISALASRVLESWQKAEALQQSEAQSIRNALDEVNNGMLQRQENLEHKLRDEANSIRKAFPSEVSYITLVLVIVLAGIETLRLLAVL